MNGALNEVISISVQFVVDLYCVDHFVNGDKPYS